ncbi:MAG: sigma 54-interacting transcriptional regulator [Desulfosarcinaceae bacterium]|nr:sigma 54-interacting transcriptional regulator [Desulfosarcinaceae bacterium]
MITRSSETYQGLRPKDAEMIFGAIMQHSKDGLFVTDHRGVVVMVNRATEEMCAIEAKQILGRNVRDLVREGFWDPSVSLEVIRKRRTISLIQTTRRQKRLLSTGIPIFDNEGELRFVIVNDRDISFISTTLEILEAEEITGEGVRFELSELGLAAAEMEGLVVRSDRMAEVLRTAVRAARFDIPLVISGESGVGKSMLARLVHHLSQRRNGPFMDLNCGAIAPNLLESELFGHEKGAFTGAAASGKKGLFEMAHQGTLFLDEIGDVPLALQVKLLKFLESKTLIRVGGVAPIAIDTRIVAATNHDLEALVADGGFRADLFFRLNVVPIEIPPLRERPEEIEDLTRHFLERFNTEFGTHKVITKSARLTLCDYSFPGNVRELENLIKRLVTMTEGDFIRIKHLPEMLLKSRPCDDDGSGEALGTYQEEVAAFERRIILKAIEKHGSQRKAAQALGLSQSTLSRKLKASAPGPGVVHD